MLRILGLCFHVIGDIEALVLGVLRDAVTLRCYAAPLSAAVLQAGYGGISARAPLDGFSVSSLLHLKRKAYMAAIAGISSAKERKRITKVYQALPACQTDAHSRRQAEQVTSSCTGFQISLIVRVFPVAKKPSRRRVSLSMAGARAAPR